MKKRSVLLLSILVLCVVLISSLSAETIGFKKRRPKPHEFGNVIMDKTTAFREDVAPVVFKHWLHRSKYTCRLCHVDIGFGMQAGSTGVTCEDNRIGLYCGACHNGGESFAREEGGKKNCDRCHSLGRKVKFKNDFYEFRKTMPTERFGNGIDWLTAEEKKIVVLKDYLKGVSIKRRRIEDPKEMPLMTRELGMPDIIFSHTKHAVWSGCELCHPDIFGVIRGATTYNMEDIFAGKFCGSCHSKVAFPNYDCQRCHAEAVY